MDRRPVVRYRHLSRLDKVRQRVCGRNCDVLDNAIVELRLSAARRLALHVYSMALLASAKEMIKHIKETLEMMREHELEELEFQQENLKLRLRKHNRGRQGALPPTQPSVPLPPSITALTDRGDDATGVVVRSSTVGTFYRAIESAAKPFVDVGETVKAGQVLAVVRALNLTSEIKSACAGSIVKVYVENGHVVQYGDHLFEVRPR